VKEQVTIVGCLHIASGLLGAIGGTIVLVVITGGGLMSGDPDAIMVTGILGPAIASVLFALAIPAIIGCVALLKRAAWARYLVLVLGCLHLPALPFGTILGIYTIWVLSRPETTALFAKATPPRPAVA
jgi:hypothetical protein